MIVAKTQLECEPSFLTLGPNHFAVGFNNSIWYFKWKQAADKSNVQMVCKREYYGSIKQVVMNDKWTAVLSQGQVTLH